MTPEEKIKHRYAIVWDAIERMAFKPQNHDSWLSLYERTLPDLWGLQRGDVQARRNAGFDVHFLNLSCDYVVDDVWKYTVTIGDLTNASQVIWTSHVDPDYISKAALHNLADKYPLQDQNRCLRDDVNTVLTGMIFHPSHHCHIEDLGVTASLEEVQNIGVHDIRIGGGITNAYVFLYHLRYQFSIISEEVRERERNRLIDLFTKAISERCRPITAKELFNFRR